MIEANERIMALGGGNGAALHSTTRRLYELQIKTLRGAPRDAKQQQPITSNNSNAQVIALLEQAIRLLKEQQQQ